METSKICMPAGHREIRPTTWCDGGPNILARRRRVAGAGPAVFGQN